MRPVVDQQRAGREDAVRQHQRGARQRRSWQCRARQTRRADRRGIVPERRRFDPQPVHHRLGQAPAELDPDRLEQQIGGRSP